MIEGEAVVPVDGGDASEIARGLLALTDVPRDVVWVPGRHEFVVPDALAERYRQSLTATRGRSKKGSSNG